MPRREYRTTSSVKLPLSVPAQQKLVEAAEGRERAMVLAFISTGMHPSVLAEPREHGLAWNADTIGWKRPKTDTQVLMLLSRAMRESPVLTDLGRAKGLTRQRIHQLLTDLGDQVGIHGTNPLALRHVHFCNRARLGHNAFDIANTAGTDLRTVYRFYTVGLQDGQKLEGASMDWLKWLMEG